MGASLWQTAGAAVAAAAAVSAAGVSCRCPSSGRCPTEHLGQQNQPGYFVCLAGSYSGSEHRAVQFRHVRLASEIMRQQLLTSQTQPRQISKELR